MLLLRRSFISQADLSWSEDLEFYIRHAFSCLGRLFDLALLLKLREIASCGCIRDMRELLDFIVRDVGFL